MVLAVGATAVHPRLAIELAAELAGTRGAETLTPDRHDRRPRRRVRGRPAQDARPDGHQRRRVVHRRRAHRRRRPRRRRSSRAASRPPPRGPAGRPWPTSPTASSAAARRRWPSRSRPPAASRACPDPGFARFRADGEAPPLLAADRRRDPGPGGRRATMASRRPTSTARSPAIAPRSPARRPSASVPRDELRIRPVGDADRRSTRSRTRARSSAASSSRR